MGVKKLIKKIVKFLNLSEFQTKGKKNSLRTLLCKLKKKRMQVLKELLQDMDKKREKELQEELKLIALHIEKVENKLTSLEA